jgi:dimethylargininase
MFKHAIVRQPCPEMVGGLRELDTGAPDHARALAQHADYVCALQECGLEVEVLEADSRFPDSTFVEDPAVVTRSCAIIANPGAPSRNAESLELEPVLARYFDTIERITAPGLLDGGDIMMVEDHFYIGLSARTNQAGADQLMAILTRHGMTGSVVHLEKVLHLKTGVNYLANNILLVSGEFIDREDFAGFDRIVVAEEEAYAANSLWINGTVLVPAGYPRTLDMIREAGFATREVDTSEFRKLDGGLSCLSLRF